MADPAPARPKKIPITAGEPDIESAKPVEGEDTVQTSGGELDRSTVEAVKVGGTGVVHIHEKGPDVEATEAKAEADAKDRQQGMNVKKMESKATASPSASTSTASTKTTK